MSTARMYWYRRITIALSLLLMLGGSATAPALAQDSDPNAGIYGSIAYNESTGAYGWSRNYKTQDEADDRAMEECGRRCKVVMQFWGEYCGALAKSPNGAWGTASGATDREARRKTLDTCRSYRGTNCAILVSRCNDAP
jgi:Domain of unknown function (DUF4189)